MMLKLWLSDSINCSFIPFTIYYRHVLTAFHWCCYFHYYQIQMNGTLLESSMVELHQMPKSSRQQSLQQKCRTLPKTRIAILRVMTVKKQMIFFYNETKLFVSWMYKRLTFGVIHPTKVGAATPVNAPIPLVTAINEPA